MSEIVERMGEHLERERPWLGVLVGRLAGPALMRLEPLEDLVQGVCVRALEVSSTFEWRSEAAFRAWLELLVAQHLSARRRHWTTLRRGGGRFLRRLGAPESTSWTFGALAASQSGPSTFASRREEVEMAAQALALLPPTDREWVASWLADESLADAASARGQSYDAAQRARSRALVRLQRVFELVRRKWQR